MNKSEIAERAAREIIEQMPLIRDLLDSERTEIAEIAEVVARAIAESQAPQPPYWEYPQVVELGDGEPSQDWSCVECSLKFADEDSAQSHSVETGHAYRSGAAQEVSPPSPEPCLLPRHLCRDLRNAVAETDMSVVDDEQLRLQPGRLLKRAEKAEGDTRELKAALKKFGQHNRNCNTRRPNVGDAPQCDCGFQEVIEGL